MRSTINYDRKYDVFYMRPNPYVPSYADEDENGITTLRSFKDDSPVGMVILGFKSRMKNGSLKRVKLPMCIDLDDPAITRIIETR